MRRTHAAWNRGLPSPRRGIPNYATMHDIREATIVEVILRIEARDRRGFDDSAPKRHGKRSPIA